MEIPKGNFFQVTINAQKLSSFVEDIFRKISQQQQRIDKIAKCMSQIKASFSDKKTYGELAEQLSRIKQINQQENNYLRLYMKDADKKGSDKIVELQNTIVMLNKKIISVKETLQEDINLKISFIEKKIGNVATIEELESKLKPNFQHMREEIQNIDHRQTKIAERVQQQHSKIADFNKNVLQRLIHVEQQHNNDKQMFSALKGSTKEQRCTRSLSKKENKKKHNKHDMSGLIERFQQTEDNLLKGGEGISNRRSILANNRIVRSNENVNIISKSQFSKKQNKKKQFQDVINEKLIKIEEMAGSRVDNLQKDIAKITNRTEIVDEHIGILSRRFDKQKTIVGEMAQNIRRYDDKKIDQKVIQALRTTIKKIGKDLEEAIELRLTKDNFEKEKVKIYDKIHFLDSIIQTKAEKNQVKKGFGFVQQKIKEMIIVLTEDRCANQDGAVKRMPFKCLSCDKDLQVQQMDPVSTLKGSWTKRSTSNQLRKRVRLGNLISNTVSTLNGSDD